MSDESLLDVFVNVGAKGMEEVELEIKSFVERAKKAFSGAATIDVKTSSKSWADIGEIEDAKKAIEGLRQELLKFGRDKDQVSIQVRLLGNTDVSRKLSDIQSQVNIANKQFQLSEPGDAGNADRIAAIKTITDLRERDLAVLYTQLNAELQLKGLDAVYENRAAAIRGASEQAERFALELKDLNSIVQKSGSTGLREEFIAINKSAAEIKLNLKSALSAGDLVGAENAVAELDTLRQKLDEIRRSASKQIVINADIDSVVDGFDEIKKRFANANRLLSFETRGSLGVEQKVAIANIEKEMRDLVITFDILANKMDRTADDFMKMKQLAENFNQAAVSIGEIKDKAIAAGASTNSLSNNAYQLGQAFEDAAVGFSLNGITGAVRGAANNVTFLVNNLAQAGELTSLLGSRVATLLPLFTGLGTAGIFIIPSLITWLKKLNEIEEETKDLAELMKKEFEDTEFEVRIKINRLSIERALGDARSATESIAAFLRQAEESDRLTLALKTKIDKSAFGEAAEGVAKLYDDISKALLQRQIDVSQKQFKGVTAEGIAEFADPDPKLVRNIQELQNAFNDAVSAQAKLENDVRGRQFFDPGDIKKAAENLAFLQKNFKEVGKSGLFNAEQLEKIEEEIDVLVKRYQDLQQESRELQLVNDIIFGTSLRIGQDNLESMTRELQLQSNIESGLADESDRFLFNLNEEYIAVKKLNDEILRRGNNSEAAKRLADQNLLEAKLEAELKIRRRIAEVEFDIRGIRDDQNGDVKSISRAIDDMGSFVISGDTETEKQIRALQDLTRELQNLQDALGQVKGPNQGGPAGGGALDAMLKKEIADEQQRRIAERKKLREEQVRRNREKQKEDKEDKGITNESIKRNVDAEKKFIDDAAAVLGEMEQQRKIQEPSVPEQPPAPTEEQKTPMQTEMERSAEEAAKAVDELKKQSEQLAEELKREKAAADRRREETALWLRGIEEDLRSRNQANPEEDKKKEQEVRPRLEAQRERERKMEEEFDAKERASIEESQRRAKEAEEEAIRQDVERWRRLREFGPEGQQSKREPIFAPEDIQAQGNAQANANARAMDNTNFRSTTLQALLETNNQILTKLNENVTKIPGSQGLA